MSIEIRQQLERAPLDLATFNEPIRLAVLDQQGRPRIVSLWFLYQDGQFFCATHEDAWLVSRLQKEPLVGYEVATSQPPYCGVRGTAEVSLQPLGDNPLLEKLINRYLGDGNQKLAQWLLSRQANELMVTIQPTLVSAWDYSHRMQPMEVAHG